MQLTLEEKKNFLKAMDEVAAKVNELFIGKQFSEQQLSVFMKIPLLRAQRIIHDLNLAFLLEEGIRNRVKVYTIVTDVSRRRILIQQALNKKNNKFLAESAYLSDLLAIIPKEQQSTTIVN